ncbi:MAG: TIR domain-containing protein, partial [Synergistaceae bacterium]|nr:TIR domain-containing protein [Synergistaceae bacterium]
MPIVFKCKMCGGDLDIQEGATIVKCLYCGSKQTLPKIDDDKRRSLYSRANYFRQNGDFDKAVKIYEQILSEDNTDAETYWSIVLCRYGVEYVEDPATHSRVPTVNRIQSVPVTSDADYNMALKYADVSQYAIYQAEAKAIDKIQRDMLEISRREKPFDVFISYKDSDNNGQRTIDSVLAVDLYEKLTQEGFKVFCSRITLEDKIGQKYEPYIFAALSSAPVMIALGTRPEYFNAVWVRNEWSRYLNMIHSGAKKTLIPAFRDMSPYELPEEFSHLQAQDMSKIGFMQDLIRGVRKLIRPETPKAETVIVNGGTTNAAPLLKRASMFIAEGDFENAEAYCERVLDIDPENGTAYLGKLMAKKRLKRRKDFANLPEPFDEDNDYKRFVRYGNAQIISELKGYIAIIKDRVEEERRKAEQA